MLAQELEPKIEWQDLPNVQNALLDEQHVLDRIALDPLVCHSFQSCQAIRLMLFINRMKIMLDNNFVDITSLFHSKWPDKFLLQKIGDYSYTELQGPLRHLQRFLDPSCHAVGTLQEAGKLSPAHPPSGNVLRFHVDMHPSPIPSPQSV